MPPGPWPVPPLVPPPARCSGEGPPLAGPPGPATIHLDEGPGK